MPFTFAHPAIVLPLVKYLRRYVSATALIIGTMLPDFEYFIRMHLRSDYSHTVWGVFLFDLPLGIALAFIFHNLVRDCLIGQLPAYFHHRFARFAGFDWNGYFARNKLVVVISFLIGIFSHILWDSFTHVSGFFAGHIPLLQSAVMDIPVYKLLQHASTLLGFIFILLYIHKLTTLEHRKHHRPDIRYWAVWANMALFILGVWYVLQPAFYVGHFIAAAISAVLLSLILVSLLWKFR